MGFVATVAAACASLAVIVSLAPNPAIARVRRVLPDRGDGDATSRLVGPIVVGEERRERHAGLRGRMLASVVAAVGGASLIGGLIGAAFGVGLGAAAWLWTGRLEPASVVRERDQVVAMVPLAAQLLASALAAGCPPEVAVEAVGHAIPGPLGARLRSVAAALRVGTDPDTAWRQFAAEPALRALGRVMAGASLRGMSPVATLDRIAKDAADTARWAAEARARSLGARAAVPLGLCFLPAFILVGVVPLVGTSISFL